MGHISDVFGLLFIASLLCSSAAEESIEKNIRKSSLILEYNWPEPSKSLERLPHPRSCHHFIHTKRDGSHVVKRCHGDKVFDYRSLRCQNKWSAKCWINIVKKGNIKKNKVPFSCPYPWGLFPDREDCSLFYECMGGKVHSRKCPDSTLFDVVERICAHSKNVLCAGDPNINVNYRTTSHPKKSWTNQKRFTTVDFRQRTPEEINSSEEVDDNSEEKVGTKSKNKFITSKLSFSSTGTKNPKYYRTTAVDFKEDSSEENGSSEEKNRTKPKSKFTPYKTSFPSSSTAKPKSYKTTIDSSSEEEYSSEEKDNRISSKHELKFTKSKIESSTNNKYIKRSTDGSLPATTIVFTEKHHLTSSSQGSHSSESFLQSSSIKPLIITENKPDKNIVVPEVTEKDVITNSDIEKRFQSTKFVPTDMTSNSAFINEEELKTGIITVIPEVHEKDGGLGEDSEKVPHSTDTASSEVTSSPQLFSNRILEVTTKIPAEFSSTTKNPETTENTEVEAEGTSNTLCPASDGHFPHPKNENLFVICSGGYPTIMKCPENLVFDSKIVSCNYKKNG